MDSKNSGKSRYKRSEYERWHISGVIKDIQIGIERNKDCVGNIIIRNDNKPFKPLPSEPSE